MGGSQSQEFMVYAEAGEDLIISCPNCNYAANMDKATSLLPPVKTCRQPATANRIGAHSGAAHHRGGRRASRSGAGVPDQDHGLHGVNSAGRRWARRRSPVRSCVLLRGDHTLNPAKLAALFPAARELRPMVAEEILNTFHSPPVIWGRSVSKSWLPESRRRAAK